ncbi:hypothetical protein BKA70DRAFT_1489402 [Coprinopsis sp. MPI-PUGE-AT-0042]|nr:hypothetical protein BKA70DRAFT_1489402 [Coprinopsis sp. MPI-PUGE-AT-0042]
MLEGPSSYEADIIFMVLMPLGIVTQLAMCLYTLRNFRRNPSPQHDAKRRLLASVSFAIWTIYSAAVLIELWNVGCRMLGRDAFPLWSVGLNRALTLTYICLGDCLMLWRCYSIWNGQRWVVLIPTFLLLAAFALGIISVVDSITHTLPRLAGVLCVACSVVSNVIITSLIIYKLLVARREAMESEMYDYAPRFYRDLIVILVESAAPLALAGVCAVALTTARIYHDRRGEAMTGTLTSDGLVPYPCLSAERAARTFQEQCRLHLPVGTILNGAEYQYLSDSYHHSNRVKSLIILSSLNDQITICLAFQLLLSLSNFNGES